MTILCQCPVCQKKNRSVTELTAREDGHCRCGQKFSIPAITTHTKCSAQSAKKEISGLLYGALYSLMGSSSVAALWAGVALVWQMEVGWMAWGLGAMAGFGMACKNEEGKGTWGGMIAATMSLAGIFAAKSIVFLAVLFPMLRRIHPDVSITATASLYFATMFDLFDGLFIGLAILTAFKLGSQTNECE